MIPRSGRPGTCYVARLHDDQPDYSQLHRPGAVVGSAWDFGGTGSWARLEDGSWDIVVPVSITFREGRTFASYAGIEKEVLEASSP